MNILNGNDEILLLTILGLKDNAYGAMIMQRLTEITGREWSIGAIYDPLYRLEKKGYIRSELTEPTAERGGRSKRVYGVTESGLEALRRHRKIWKQISSDIPEMALHKILK
jgi:DNA-binding PadR family transcriptional regulator